MIYQIPGYPVVIDIYSSGSGGRTSSNLTANSTIRITANLAILRIQQMIFMRDTRISLVTRVERSYLAFAYQRRYLLKGGGSITAWPLFIVCLDIQSIEYSYRAFDDHSQLAAWHVSKTRRLRVSIFSPQLYSSSYITPLLIRSRQAPNTFSILVPTAKFYNLSNITWEAFNPRLDTLLAKFFFLTARLNPSQNRSSPRAAFISYTPLYLLPIRFYSIQVWGITVLDKAEDVSVQEYLILVLRYIRRSLIFLDKSLRANIFQ